MTTIETGPRVEDLGVSDHTLASIVLQAKRFDAIVPESDPNDASNESDDREVDVLEDQADNPARYELTAAINGLEPTEREALIALTWLGRGDYEPEQWEEAKSVAAERNNGSAARYLTGIPLLGNYLEAGAAALGINITDAETEILTHDQNPDPTRSTQ
ncbi:MAG: hypothetical protein CMK06_05840 [Ponticaulis sp.]|nr:hypothetical protein [Ponticaulis sp.]|tara:strand:- start:1969 stop:2445 length:477 start_codon:yes stop_codon:yes gene_type:complete